MTADDLKAALRDLAALMDQPAAKLNSSATALCLAKIGVAVEDDSFEVPADVFAELNADGRKLALAGLMALIVASAGK